VKRFAVVLAILLALFANAHAGEPEFGGQCTMGLAEGRVYKTDCSVLWLGPDDKIYCFATPEAKQAFLKAPKENLSRAQAFWDDPANLKRLIRRE
jgi:hypothetical protein